MLCDIVYLFFVPALILADFNRPQALGLPAFDLDFFPGLGSNSHPLDTFLRYGCGNFSISCL